MAEDIDQQLNSMATTLKDLVSRLNASQTQEQDAQDQPIVQILDVLNGHLTLLQWIDQQSTLLQAKMQDVQTQTKSVGHHG